LELSYVLPLSPSFSLSFFGSGRFPFYENPKGYEGPTESTGVAALRWAAMERLSLHANYTLFHQGFARWDGERDPNIGVIAHMALIGASYRLSEDASVGLDLRLPIDQRPIGDGDAFEFGPTLLANLSFGF